jgi:hypothetical protein
MEELTVSRTLSALLRQLCDHFRRSEIVPENEYENIKTSLSLDEQLIINADKMTNQPFAFGSRSF